jgi:hypothetical protein
MKQMPRIVAAGIFVLVLTVSYTASAQQRGRRGGGFGFGGSTNSSVATLAGAESVQKDLGVSGDIVGKLNSLREDLAAARQKEFQTAGINLQEPQNMTAEQRQKMQEISKKLNDEFHAKVQSLVSGDQLKRLKQIQLQANLRNQGPAALTDADIATELKISDDQKKKLNDLDTEFSRKQRELFTGGGFNADAFSKLREERTAKTMDVLTAEQKETLKTLQGSSFDVGQLNQGFGRRGKGN